jgi:hypothetical protein
LSSVQRIELASAFHSAEEAAQTGSAS